MRLVVDTNVWVSALLSPGGAPARLLLAFRQGALTLMITSEIVAVYEEVLLRPKFNFQPELLEEFFLLLGHRAQRINPPAMPFPDLPDLSDAPFIAAARYAGCPVVTGNARHFPPDCGVTVLSPAQCLAQLTA